MHKYKQYIGPYRKAKGSVRYTCKT